VEEIAANRDRMRRSLPVVALVATYALLETGLLLAYLTRPWWDYKSDGYLFFAVLLLQFFLLPAVAGVWSHALYGSYRWQRRETFIFLTAIFGVLLGIPSLLGIVALIFWAFNIESGWFLLLAPIVAGLLLGVRLEPQYLTRLSAEAEVRRWLAERKASIDASSRRKRARAILTASWIPVVLVLGVFAFLPETWALLSHLSKPDAGLLLGYDVRIPRQWIIMWKSADLPLSWSNVGGLAAKGPARHPGAYLRGEPPFGRWSLWTKGRDDDFFAGTELRAEEQVLNQKEFVVGSERVTCVDYHPGHYGDVTRYAFVRCASTGRFRASFDGPRDQLAAFYTMLQSTTPTPDRFPFQR
jgi:hypothetical protein